MGLQRVDMTITSLHILYIIAYTSSIYSMNMPVFSILNKYANVNSIVIAK